MVVFSKGILLCTKKKEMSMIVSNVECGTKTGFVIAHDQ